MMANELRLATPHLQLRVKCLVWNPLAVQRMQGLQELRLVGGLVGESVGGLVLFPRGFKLDRCNPHIQGQKFTSNRAGLAL